MIERKSRILSQHYDVSPISLHILERSQILRICFTPPQPGSNLDSSAVASFNRNNH